MIVIDQPHDLSADDEAALVAYVDGRLEPEERSSVETRAAADPSFAAALALQQEGRDAIATAAESTGAPLALRSRVEGLAAQGRRHGDRRPSARTRLGGIRWPGAGLVAGAVAAVIAALVVLGGGAPGVDDVAAAAVRAPTAKVGAGPGDVAAAEGAASRTSSSPTTSRSSAGRRSAPAPTRSGGATRARSSTRRTASGSPTRSSPATRSSGPTARARRTSRAPWCGRSSSRGARS